jgi:hypothetical protein
MDNIDAIGSGTIKLYKSGYKTDIELTIDSCVWVDDDDYYSRNLPDLDECYIVKADFTRYPSDTRKYRFECNGLNQEMDFDDIAAILGNTDYSGSSSEGAGYRRDTWYMGRKLYLYYWRSYSDDENTIMTYETLTFGVD